MVAEHEEQVRAWLDAEPSLSAQAVLTRLIEAMPTKFNDKHLRTIQRAGEGTAGSDCVQAHSRGLCHAP